MGLYGGLDTKAIHKKKKLKKSQNILDHTIIAKQTHQGHQSERHNQGNHKIKHAKRFGRYFSHHRRSPQLTNLPKQYKQFKNLKKENLRDHMSNLELVLNMLAEATTTEISKEKKPVGFENNRKIAKQGGTIAGNTRNAIEEKSGKKIVTRQNAKQLPQKKNKEIKGGISV